MRWSPFPRGVPGAELRVLDSGLTRFPGRAFTDLIHWCRDLAPTGRGKALYLEGLSQVASRSGISCVAAPELSPRRDFARIMVRWIRRAAKRRERVGEECLGLLPVIAIAPSGLDYLRRWLTQGSQSLALGLTLSAATQLVAVHV